MTLLDSLCALGTTIVGSIQHVVKKKTLSVLKRDIEPNIPQRFRLLRRSNQDSQQNKQCKNWSQ